MTSIATRGGKYFDFREMDPTSISIADIGHALGNLCRFTGHSLEFYSVGQHSVLASYMVPREYALEALLHDAHEAYIGDASSPLKACLPDYSTLENCVAAAVRKAFRLPSTTSDVVKETDLALLWFEQRLVVNNWDQWSIPTPPPIAHEVLKHALLQRFGEECWPVDTHHHMRCVRRIGFRIPFWTPQSARENFLDRYRELVA